MMMTLTSQAQPCTKSLLAGPRWVMVRPWGCSLEQRDLAVQRGESCYHNSKNSLTRGKAWCDVLGVG